MAKIELPYLIMPQLWRSEDGIEEEGEIKKWNMECPHLTKGRKIRKCKAWNDEEWTGCTSNM